MEDTTKQTIERMGIYELRTLARNVGVSSPTTLKRQELIEAITQILEGKKEASPIKKVGRPPKKMSFNSLVMDIFVPQDFVDFANAERSKVYESEALVFEKEVDSIIYDNKVRVDRKGYLRKTKTGAYFLKDKNSLVFVPQNMVAELKLMEGDLVEGGAWQMQGKCFDILFVVEKLNGKTNLQREIVSFTSIKYPADMSEGQRRFVKYSDQTRHLKDVSSMFSEYVAKGFKVNVIAVGLLPETMLKIKSSFENIEYSGFVSYYEEGPKEASENVIDAINNTIALARTGEKVLLYVLDVSTVISELKTYFERYLKEDNGIDTLIIMRKLFSSNRCLTNGGMVSFLAGTTEEINLEYM